MQNPLSGVVYFLSSAVQSLCSEGKAHLLHITLLLSRSFALYFCCKACTISQGTTHRRSMATVANPRQGNNTLNTPKAARPL